MREQNRKTDSTWDGVFFDTKGSSLGYSDHHSILQPGGPDLLGRFQSKLPHPGEFGLAFRTSRVKVARISDMRSQSDAPHYRTVATRVRESPCPRSDGGRLR
jgi:hypothetical protein